MTQDEFIEILANDCGMNRAQRNAFISLRLGREIHYLSDLTKTEKSQVILQFKSKKEALRGNRSFDFEEAE